MRRGFLVVAVLLVFPAAAPGQTPALTLKAPKATKYGHQIDFAGRLSPAAKNARIRLVRGTETVAYARTRANGSFLFKVKVARPGPFRAVWGNLASAPIVVEIHPKLEVTVVANVVTATLTPPEAGLVRVLVRAQSLDKRLRTPARVELATTARTVRIRVQSVPRQGYATVSKVVRASLVPSTLSVGMTHPAVAELARRLGALKYAIPSTSSTFSYDLIQSVYAFQKVTGLPRTGQVDDRFWRRLERATTPAPRYRTPANHLEVDKARQVLLVVRGGKVALISPVSTGGFGAYTPVGRFSIIRKVTGYDPSPLGVLLNPMYFYGGYAIHGNPSVPPYPASHGCVRVPNFVINRIYYAQPYGETVYVY